MADRPPDNTSATILALDALLSSILLSQRRPDLQIPIRKRSIRLGIERLMVLGRRSGLRGFREELIIELSGGRQYKHTAGGIGGSVLGTVLSKAAILEYIPIHDSNLIGCIEDLVARTKHYSRKEGGGWLIPSDEKGPPTAWNNAFAIEALIDFEQMYLVRLCEGDVESAFVEQYADSIRWWKWLASLLGSLLFVVLLSKYAVWLGGIATWFNSQSPFTQGLIMIFIALGVERLMSLTFKILTALRARWQ